MSVNAFKGVLNVIQLVLLCAIGFASVIASPRTLLLEVTTQANIPVDFRGITLSIPDYLLFALLILTGARLALDADYRAGISSTGSIVFSRFGGLFWAGLVIWMAVGILYAGQPVVTRYAMLHALAVLLLAIILADFVRRGQESPLFWALFASALLQSVIAVLQTLTNGPLGLDALGEVGRFWYDTSPFYRATGLSMHPNYLGGYLLITIFAAVLVARRNVERGLSPALPILAGTAGAFGLVATMSRSALLGGAVGLGLAFVIAIRPLLRRISRPALLILGATLVVVAIWGGLVLLPNAQTRLLASREFFFADSWEVIQKSPLIGVGAGNLMLEVSREVARTRGPTTEPLLPVHNVYLFVLAEHGLPGLILFLLGCGAILIRVRPQAGSGVFIWGCCFLALCVISLFDNYFWAVHPFRDMFFWVIGVWWGMAAAAPVESASRTNSGR